MHESEQAPEQTIEAGILNLFAAIRVLDPLRFHLWSSLGLTTAQLRVLFLIRDQPGVTAGALAARLSVTPPTVSGIVDRLVRMELARREEDPGDRRLVRNRLTELGQDVCGRIATGNERFLHRIFIEMPAERIEDLTRGLEAFIQASQIVAEVEPKLAETAIPLQARPTPGPES